MLPRVLFALAVLVLAAVSLHLAFGHDDSPPVPAPAAIPLPERAQRECGLNSLYLMLHLSGHDVTFDQVRTAVPVGPSGTSLLELRQAASRLGVRTAVRRCSMDELASLPKPVIAYFHPKDPEPQGRPGHYVVVLRADTAGVEVIDGTLAASFRYSARHFEAEWSGHLLTPSPLWSWVRPLALTAVAGAGVAFGLCCWRAPRRAEAAPRFFPPVW
jgi:predicted double-glycine peptidase